MNLFLLTYLLVVDLFVSKIDVIASYNNSKLSSNLNLDRNKADSTQSVEEKALWLPEVKGWIPYNDTYLESLLTKCNRNTKSETLLTCASLLNTSLVKDGYITSRVYSINKDNIRFFQRRKNFRLKFNN